MFKLAIFDMDGTLLDTLGDLANAVNFALARMGHPVHEQRDYLDYVGRGPYVLLERALPEGSRDMEAIERAKGLFLDYYAAHSQDVTRPYPGIMELLGEIRSAGMKTAICSNKPHENVTLLAPLYFPGLIDYSVGFRDGVNPKPNPSVVHEIMERFGASRDETCYIGDSGVDMETGRNAGLFTIGVSWGFRPRKELVDSGADIIVDSADILLKIMLDKNSNFEYTVTKVKGNDRESAPELLSESRRLV